MFMKIWSFKKGTAFTKNYHILLQGFYSIYEVVYYQFKIDFDKLRMYIVISSNHFKHIT